MSGPSIVWEAWIYNCREFIVLFVTAPCQNQVKIDISGLCPANLKLSASQNIILED